MKATNNGGTAQSNTVFVKLNQTISNFNTIATHTYGDSAFTVSASASSNLAVTFTATGNCSASGANGTSISITGAGSCTVTANQSGNTQWNNATSVSQSFTINKATPTITWANPTDISYGTALGSTQLNATATNPNGGATVAGTFTYTPPAGTVLGAGNGQSLSVAFAPTDTANYNGNSNGVSINVNAASTSISNVSGSGTYGGTTSLQATLKDAGGTGVSGKSVSFSLNGNSVGSATTNASGVASLPTASLAGINGGTYPAGVSASFTGDSNYASNSGTASLQVNAAGTSISNVSGSGTFGGTMSVQATLKDASGSNLNGKTVTFSIDGTSVCGSGSLPACPTTTTNGVATLSVSGYSGGTHSISANFAGDSNYSSTSGTGTLTVSAASTSITWSNPTDITYGTALSATQLNATAANGSTSVPGTFAYTVTATGAQASGAILNAGSNQSLSVTFTPTDMTDYSTASGSVSINVTTAPLTVTVDSKSKVYGQPNPTLTGTVTGVVGVDGISASYSTAATQNSAVGTYAITATLNDPSNKLANYAVTNTPGALTVNQATPTITWSNPADISYGTPLSDTQLNATAWNGATSVPGTFAYSPISGTVLGAGSQALTVVFTPTDTTDYTTTASRSVPITVATAPLTVTAHNAARLYGQDNPAFTGTLTGVQNGDNISATYDTESPVDASSPVGAYTIVPTLVDPNNRLGNYSVIPANGTLTIDKAGTTTTTSNATAAYAAYGDSRVALTATVAATTTTVDEGVVTFTVKDGSDSVVGTPITGTVNGSGVATATYTLPGGTNAGSYTIDASYGSAGKFGGSSDSATLTVNKAPLTVTADDAGKVYGQANPAFSVSYSGFVNSDDSSKLGGTLAFATVATTNSAVGSYDVTPGGLTSSNYTITFAKGTLTVSQATPTITWADPADISYGTALSDTQLNATASVPGTFAYSPISGTVLGAGNHQPLSVTFTPTDSADYTTASGSVHINVTGAGPAITWNTPAGIVDGTALSDTQLNATASVSGTFAYSPAAGTVLGAGSQTLTVVFTPTDTTNYTTTATSSVPLTVTKAPLTVTAHDAERPYGQANPAFDGTLTGVQNGDNITAGYASAATAGSPAGTYGPTSAYPIVPTLADPDGKLGNYDLTSTNGTLTIDKVDTTISVSNTTATLGGSAAFTATVAATTTTVNEGVVTFTVKDSNGVQVGTSITGTVNGSGVATVPFTLTSTPFTAPEVYTITAVYGGTGNFNGSSDSHATLTVNQGSGSSATPTPGAGGGCTTGCSTTATPEAPSSVLYGAGVALVLLVLGWRARRRRSTSTESGDKV